MGTKKKRANSFYYRQTYKGLNYNIKNYWCPGDALKEGDEELLKVVKEFYMGNG